jgi:hypothetical protein
MWPAYESNATAVQAAVIELVADVRDTVNRNLESNGN